MNNENQKRIGFWKSYGLYWKNYFNFHSTSSRPEYWWVYLMNKIIGIIVMAIFSGTLIAGLTQNIHSGNITKYSFNNVHSMFNILFSSLKISLVVMIALGIFWLLNIIPYLSLTYRRYHDGGFSGWWMWLTIVLPKFLNIIKSGIGLYIMYSAYMHSQSITGMNGSYSSVFRFITIVCFIANIVLCIMPTKQKENNKYK